MSSTTSPVAAKDTGRSGRKLKGSTSCPTGSSA